MASRRNLNTTDESTQSTASSLQQHAHLAFQYLEATELENSSDEVVLRRSLTTRSVISITSSFAVQHQRAAKRPELQHIRQIGEGLQGTIFEQVGQVLAMKKENPGNDRGSSNLRHEYTLHGSVVAAFGRYAVSTGSDVHVPQLFGIVSKSDDAFWKENLQTFPEGYQICTTLVRMERVLPLPTVIRRALVNQFYPFQNDIINLDTRNSVLRSPANKHCLARTYLGRNDGPVAKVAFSLRNFPLYLKTMERLGLDTQSLAVSMGKSYAIMHWGACVNADDVEFVLGSSAISSQEQPPGFQHRAVGLFLLDFGQCEVVDLSEDIAVVYQAFKGAMVTGDNQLFIPHCGKSPQLFAAFKKAYIEAGNTILQDKKLDEKFNLEDFMMQYEEYAEDFLY